MNGASVCAHTTTSVGTDAPFIIVQLQNMPKKDSGTPFRVNPSFNCTTDADSICEEIHDAFVGIHVEMLQHRGNARTRVGLRTSSTCVHLPPSYHVQALKSLARSMTLALP